MSSQVPRRARVRFVNERELATGATFVAYCTEPWEVLSHLEIGRRTIVGADQLPENLARLIRECVGREICRSVGVSNSDIDGDTWGVIYFRPDKGREDDIIPLLRELTGRPAERDPERSPEFDMDDLMAELLTQLLFPRPRPRA